MNIKINFTPFVFAEHTVPLGALTREPREQACWWFYVLAEKIRVKVGKSTEDQFGLLEGELWMDKEYERVAYTVALQYGLESPDEFAKAWPEVIREALRCGMPEPHPEYMRLVPRRLIT